MNRDKRLPTGYRLEPDKGERDPDAQPFNVYKHDDLVTWGASREEAIANAWRHDRGEIE